MKDIVLIGYSGHAFVIADILEKENNIIGYLDISKKNVNPYKLNYLGNEDSEGAKEMLKNSYFFVAIGNNILRHRIFEKIENSFNTRGSVKAIHRSAIISDHATIEKGVLISANATINPLAKVGKGVICNTSSVIEHECNLGPFVHVGPGAILCGAVSVGENSFIGANSVVKEGTKIGKNVVIGAGSVVLKDIVDNLTVVGNPQRTLRRSINDK